MGYFVFEKVQMYDENWNIIFVLRRKEFNDLGTERSVYWNQENEFNDHRISPDSPGSRHLTKFPNESECEKTDEALGDKKVLESIQSYPQIIV